MNNMLNCLIVDDEPLARKLLSDYVQKVPYLKLLRTCSGPMEALEFLRDNPVDLLFLDIQMPEITGLTLLKILQKKPWVILTTAYSEYALESYDLDVVDYLLKPITLERFLKAMEKINQRMQGIANQQLPSEQVPAPAAVVEPGPAYIFVKDGTKLVKVKISEIMYVEGMKDYVAIHTPQQRIVTLQRLKAMEEQLPENQFIRIHNSYIVALEWLDSIHKEKVKVGNALLPISDSYRKSFKDFIEKNHIKMD
ncbi:MAG: LytTR family DNA-binding domain-containing protein [Haliscomenobacter sp.]|uniref:LytR/AlgR family response regulator transcription factor n=1 Tax=Haliscomenobacter sp. TaxID=2717303 RepID=UPI0029A7499C|nr:LytTR family DNA-binding domain-containing protein [Haliscomenobacter sp.]MDX2067915.1 LytTR family DNA-binding domain-containing protein [Haliscomenobacter sp.]